MLFTILNIKLP